MVKTNRSKWIPGVMMALALALPALANGCSSTDNPLGAAQNALCGCNFKPGADQAQLTASLNIDANAAGQFTAFAQAVGDLSATATATLTDVTIACRNMAADFGATQAELATQEAQSARDKATGYCALAKGKLSAFLTANGSANAGLTAVFDPPKCSASVDAKVNCDAKCKVDASCDIQATPPTCEGGELTVKCEGRCTGKCEGSAELSVSCNGSCSATCEGSCQATGGATVDCDGTCSGTCAAGGSTGGSGLQTDGTCKGTCSGTCTARAGAQVTCNGTCAGKCTGTCTPPSGSVAVKCEGECSGGCQGTAKAPKCKGGTLKGGCEARGDCSAHCDASAKARAECRPPDVRISLRGTINASAQAQFDTIVTSLQANLPAIAIAAQARGTALINIATSLADPAALKAAVTANASAAGCVISTIAPVAAEAMTNATVAVNAAADIGGSVGIAKM